MNVIAGGFARCHRLESVDETSPARHEHGSAASSTQ